MDFESLFLLIGAVVAVAIIVVAAEKDVFKFSSRNPASTVAMEANETRVVRDAVKTESFEPLSEPSYLSPASLQPAVSQTWDAGSTAESEPESASDLVPIETTPLDRPIVEPVSVASLQTFEDEQIVAENLMPVQKEPEQKELLPFEVQPQEIRPMLTAVSEAPEPFPEEQKVDQTTAQSAMPTDVTAVENVAGPVANVAPVLTVHPPKRRVGRKSSKRLPASAGVGAVPRRRRTTKAASAQTSAAAEPINTDQVPVVTSIEPPTASETNIGNDLSDGSGPK